MVSERDLEMMRDLSWYNVQKVQRDVLGKLQEQHGAEQPRSYT